jgi:hypothetical protein
VDGSLTRLRLSGLRGAPRVLWLADDERATLRSLRPPGFANRFRRTPTIPSGGRRPGDGWRSGRSRTGSRSMVGTAPAGIVSRTRCDSASSRPTIRCRSSSVASRYPVSRACSARAATRGRA